MLGSVEDNLPDLGEPTTKTKEDRTKEKMETGYFRKKRQRQRQEEKKGRRVQEKLSKEKSLPVYHVFSIEFENPFFRFGLVPLF